MRLPSVRAWAATILEAMGIKAIRVEAGARVSVALKSAMDQLAA